MLNINNKVNYEISFKRKEKKYSWSTVFAWLYLKTIGRILPKRWNRWAENILYYDKTTANNEVQTDAFKKVDESVQVDLKPEVVEKESQSVVISKDGGVQTDRVAFQDMTMQTECVETTDKNIEVDLESEVAEKEGAITSEDEGICSEVSSGSTDKDLSDTEVDGESELVWDDYCEVYEDDDEKLKERLENEGKENLVEMRKKDEKISSLTALNKELDKDLKSSANKLAAQSVEIGKLKKQLEKVNQEQEALTLSYIDREHQIEELQLEIDSLEGQNEELRSINKELKKSFVKLKDDIEDIPLKAYIRILNKERKEKELKNNLTAEKKVSSIKKHANGLYNEKFVQSFTDSLPKNALEKSIETKTKSLGSSGIQKLAKSISNKFSLPEKTNSTPNSFMSCTNSTASAHSLNGRRAVRTDF